MGATNTTTYYNLSQFIGTDKPAWLQDYNGDMLKIDTAINNAKTAADSAANAASAAQNDATTALGDITTINGNILTINTTLGTAVGAINTINSLIGNGTPTTTDQTIIGAINEINAKVPSFEYDSVSVTADGTGTYGDLQKAAFDAFKAVMDDTSLYAVHEIDFGGAGVCLNGYPRTKANFTNLTALRPQLSLTVIDTYEFSSTAGDNKFNRFTTSNNTVSDKVADTAGAGTKITIYYEKIEV